jgi:hypothetical protein
MVTLQEQFEMDQDIIQYFKMLYRNFGSPVGASRPIFYREMCKLRAILPVHMFLQPPIQFAKSDMSGN